MKRVLLFVAVSVCAVAAETPPLPTFDQRIESPGLSLFDGAKFSPLPFDGAMKQVAAWFRTEAKPRRMLSQMPIVVPGGDVDTRMLVLIPDSQLDPKMVISPSIDPVK